jgi:hypothetical protein
MNDEKTLLRQLQREVERQCQFAMISLQDMEEASANSDGKLFWYSAQNLLISVVKVSLMLWPPDPRYPEVTEALRESLGVTEDSPLRDRSFPERFLSFDEQLHEWYEASKEKRFFDSYTEPLDVLADTSPQDRFRGYNTEDNTLLFHNEPYPLSPISTAVEEICRKAEEEFQKPRFGSGS